MASALSRERGYFVFDFNRFNWLVYPRAYTPQFEIHNDNGPLSSPSSFRSAFVLRVFVVLEHGPRSDTGK